LSQIFKSSPIYLCLVDQFADGTADQYNYDKSP